MEKDLTLVIMAAGMGSRFGGLKQIEPIDEYGNFILDYSIYDAMEAGFDSVVFVIKEEMYDDFRNTVGKRIEDKIKTKYAFPSISAELPVSLFLSVKIATDKPSVTLTGLPFRLPLSSYSWTETMP